MQYLINPDHPLNGIAAQHSEEKLKTLFREPLIILASPRSGSTLLFEQLTGRAPVWSIGGESHAIFSAFPHLKAENVEMDSGCLDERHAQSPVDHMIRAAFLHFMSDYYGRRYLDMPAFGKPAKVTFVEKTPRNALNIPFMLKVFPDARFIYLFRDPYQNIASIIEAWNIGLNSNTFVTFRDLPGWDRKKWCLVLPPGWRNMRGKTLAEIATFQWEQSNRIIIEKLAELPKERQYCLSYQELVNNPDDALQGICDFAGIRFEQPAGLNNPGLKLSNTTVTPPDPDKWKKYEQDLVQLNDVINKTFEDIRRYCTSVRAASAGR